MNFLCRRGFFARKCQGGSVICRRKFRRSFFLSLPHGGRCRAYARRMRGRSSSVFVCRREFRRLRAANYFAHGGSSSQWPRPPSLVPSGQFTLSPLHSVSAWRRKLRSFPCSSSSRRTRFAGLRREQRGIGQNATGDGSDEHFVLIVAFPRTPLRGTRTCWILQNFRRAKMEWPPRFIPGHWALGLQKLPLLRFPWCAWRCRANDTGPVSHVGATLVVARDGYGIRFRPL